MRASLRAVLEHVTIEHVVKGELPDRDRGLGL